MEIFEHIPHLRTVQENDHFCGPAVLQSVLEKQGIHVSQIQISQLARTTSAHGTSPQMMVSVLRSLGLKAKIVNLKSIEELRASLLQNPSVIALINSGGEAHWVIIDSIKSSGGVRVMDPWQEFKSLRVLSLDELFAMWDTVFEQTPYSHLAIVVSR